MAASKSKMKYSVLTGTKLRGFGRGGETVNRHSFKTRKQAEKFMKGAQRWESISGYRGFPQYRVIGMEVATKNKKRK